MTALMVLWRRGLPWRQREALPPAQITNSLLASVDLDDDLSSPQQARLALANHFAYGAAMGSIYGLIAGAPSNQRPIASGVGYGLAVWAVNYLGLLPSLGLYRSARDEPPQRNLLMVSAHVLWGAGLGLLTEAALAPPRHPAAAERPAAQR
jgi:hypothetical protein